ncbi:MAG: hypothetical protein AB1762_20250 [Gemmatimonadota bacterium]
MLSNSAGGRHWEEHTLHRARTVYVVGAVPRERERVVQFVRGAADRILQCVSLGEMDPNGVREVARVIILVPHETETSKQHSSIRQHRANDPATAISLYATDGTRMPHQLAACAKAGVDDFVISNEPDAGQRLHSEVLRRLHHALPASLVREVTPRIAASALRYWTWCYRNGYRALHVDDVADTYGENPTTVNQHLRDAGLPTLHKAISSARLLYVGHRLDSTEVTIKSIAESLSFPSEPALDMFVKRATNLTPSELRERGAVECIKEAIGSILLEP